MRNSKKHNKLYNYIVNTFGLSKEKVMEHVDERLKSLDQKIEHILKDKINSNEVQSMILNKISQIVKNGFDKGGYFPDRLSFERYVKDTLNTLVKEHLNENYEVEVKVVKKDAIIVHKA